MTHSACWLSLLQVSSSPFLPLKSNIHGSAVPVPAIQEPKNPRSIHGLDKSATDKCGKHYSQPIAPMLVVCLRGIIQPGSRKAVCRAIRAVGVHIWPPELLPNLRTTDYGMGRHCYVSEGKCEAKFLRLNNKSYAMCCCYAMPRSMLDD